MALVLNPVVTEAGRAAASNDGIEVAVGTDATR